MRKSFVRAVRYAAASAMFCGLIGVAGLATAQEPGAAPSEDAVIEEGRQLAFDRKLGNCLACHMIQGGTLPGTIGPPLIAMKARYPDKAKLRAQIWDATKANPHSIMPPFGLNGVMSEEQIDKVTEFIYTL